MEEGAAEVRVAGELQENTVFELMHQLALSISHQSFGDKLTVATLHFSQ